MSKIDKWKAKVVKTPKFLTGDVTGDLTKKEKKPPSDIATDLVNQNLSDLLVLPPDEIANAKSYFIMQVASALTNAYGRGYNAGRRFESEVQTKKNQNVTKAFGIETVLLPSDQVKIVPLKFKKTQTI